MLGSGTQRDSSQAAGPSGVGTGAPESRVAS